MSAHADNLQLQGVSAEDVDHIALANPSSSSISEKDRILLEFVKVLTLEPARMTDERVEACRKAGWKDPEIFEAAFITSLFAFLNRMADAYGLDYNLARWVPPDMRKPDGATQPAPAGKR